MMVYSALAGLGVVLKFLKLPKILKSCPEMPEIQYVLKFREKSGKYPEIVNVNVHVSSEACSFGICTFLENEVNRH